MSEDSYFDEDQNDTLADLLADQKTVKSPKLLTKSKFLNGLQCLKLLWTRCNAPTEIPEVSAFLQNIFDAGHRVGELATRRFPGGTYIREDDFAKNLSETQRLLSAENPRPLYEAGIQAGRIYARADILNPSGSQAGRWDLIEVKLSTKCKDVHLQDIAFQKYCYEQSGLLIDRCYLMHVNNQYVRRGEIDPLEFFTLLDVTEEIQAFSAEIPALVELFLQTIDLPNCPAISIREHCDKPYECQMKPICWEFLPENNVLQLSRGKPKGFDLIDQGVVLLKDIPVGFKLTDKQKIQLDCAISGREYVNPLEIARFLKSLRYPLYFMDFETLFEAIPRFDGIRPYQQVPFQFSVHMQKSPGAEIEHVAYLHRRQDDPRPEFLRILKECMGEEGDIIVYSQTFEQGRLKELGDAFPEYLTACQSMILRMVDLLVPFRSFHYYHPDQKGSASLKKVLPALVGQGYAGMTIADGGQASTEYARVTFGDTISLSERARVYTDLEIYCEFDTRAMVDILDALRKIV